MAKRGRPPTNRNDVSIKIERDIAAMIKLVAAHRGATSAEVASELLREPTKRAYLHVIRELEKDVDRQES